MIHSDTILDKVQESFPDAVFSKRLTGENSTVRMQHVVIDGKKYLIVVKKVGGE